MSTAYYTKNIGDPDPSEWDDMDDNSLVFKPYGLFVKINIKNIETLCPAFAPYISGANCKLFGFLPKSINGGFLCGQISRVYNYNTFSSYNYYPKNLALKDQGFPLAGLYSGVMGDLFLGEIHQGDTSKKIDFRYGTREEAAAWFAYGLSSYNSIDVTSIKTVYTVSDYSSSQDWPGTFPWGGENPLPTGIFLDGWEEFRDYAFNEYEVCSSLPATNFYGSNLRDWEIYYDYYQDDEGNITGKNAIPPEGTLPRMTQDFAPIFFRISFRGPNGEKKSGSTWKTYGFADDHNLNIYIKPDTGELYLYFYTNQSMGRVTADRYNSSYVETTTAITTPHNVLSFCITPKVLTYSTCMRARNMNYPDSIVWEQSGALDLNNVFYNVPKVYRVLIGTSSSSSTQRFFPVSAPKEMQTYLPMLGLANSEGSEIPTPTPRTTEQGYNFTGTWSTTASTWS